MTYVDLPSRETLKALALERRAAGVSIYLPTHVEPHFADEDRLTLRELSREAARQLNAFQVLADDTAAILERLDRLGQDREFWRFQGHSLALLACPQTLHAFRLPIALPASVEVSDRFHLKPLLRAFTFTGHAYVLAFALHGARLIEVSPGDPGREVPVPGLPGSCASEADNKVRPLGPEDHKTALAKFARQVDEALRPVLRGKEAPMILACVEQSAAVYREANTYPHLAEEIVRGAPDRLSTEELAARAQEIVRTLRRRGMEALAARFRERQGERRATAELALVARAAALGAIETLMFDFAESLPGHVDLETGAVIRSMQASAGSHDVIDGLVAMALTQGGDALALARTEMPDPGSPVAALLRFPV